MTAATVSDLAEAAVTLAARGFCVFPLRPASKEPAIREWEQKATRKLTHIGTAWRTRFRGANIGVACEPSSIVGIDLDMPKPGTVIPPEWQAEPGIVDGKDVFAALAERAGITSWPDTYTVVTPSGGWHLYFGAPEGCEIRNSASRLGPMVDVRGTGGYLVGAGSVTPAGRYFELIENAPVIPLPPWLLELLTAKGEPGFPAAPPALLKPGLISPQYAERALREELNRILGAPEGTRNHTLNRSAFALGQLAGAGLLNPAEVREMLIDAGRCAGLGLAEIVRSVTSGMTAGMKQPRSAA